MSNKKTPVHVDLFMNQTQLLTELGVDSIADIPIEDLIHYCMRVCESVGKDRKNARDGDELRFMISHAVAGVHLRNACNALNVECEPADD